MVWLQANWQVIVVPLLVAVIDLAMALDPKLQSNGILHAIQLMLTKPSATQVPLAEAKVDAAVEAKKEDESKV